MHFLTSCNECFEWNVSWKVVEKKGFLSPGKPWNLVFANPGKKHLNVCTNPVSVSCCVVVATDRPMH